MSAKVLMIDNYDSFTYNIVQYLGELGADVVTHRSDAISLDDIRRLAPSHLVLSPGPGDPDGAGITLEGKIQRGTLPRGAQLLVERKHSIDQVLHPMLKDSNNLCAEAMFYQLAALSKRAYATYKDAAAQVQRVIAQCGLQPSDYLVADGSGLSLYNYVSPQLLVAMLRYAARSEETFTHLTTALPIMGRDGTLKSRCRRTPAQDNVRAKTGTLEGVSSLTGYAMAANGHRLCFAIINQGVRTTAEGRNFQDAVCRALTQGFDTPHIRPDVQPDIVPSGEEEQNTPSLLEENP